jgi:hypothetical protein
MTRLDDEQVERYSRQLILAEVGPRGQERLGAARVAVVGTDVAAERVVAYLAAAGVGWIAADAALHAAVDPAQPDLRVVPLQDAATGPLDVVVVTGATLDAVAALLPAWSAHTAATRAGRRPARAVPPPRSAMPPTCRASSRRSAPPCSAPSSRPKS